MSTRWTVIVFNHVTLQHVYESTSHTQERRPHIRATSPPKNHATIMFRNLTAQNINQSQPPHSRPVSTPMDRLSNSYVMYVMLTPGTTLAYSGMIPR